MAKTVSQLETVLGQYVEPGGTFRVALEQTLPRIYNLGLWRDLVYETSLPAGLGYVSVPAGAESVLACTVDDNPRPIRSLWHDVKIVGRQAELSPYFGIVDCGYYPVMVSVADLTDAAATEIDGSTPTAIYAAPTGLGRADWDAALDENGFIQITVNNSDTGGQQKVELTLDEVTGNWKATPAAGFTEIRGILYQNLPIEMDILIGETSVTPVATLPVGSGVARYRRFRVSDTDEDSVVHLLLKRSAPDELADDTVIYLSNVNAIKHALLGRIAEDNADVQRAQYHWEVCNKLLDEELDAHRGAAKPMLTMDIWGGANKPYNLY